jgi:hypothetical protein
MLDGLEEAKPKVPQKFALPVELLGLGAAIVAVMFAGRIVDLLIIPVVAVGAYYAGRWSVKR